MAARRTLMPSSWQDGRRSFGWMSILLHWAGAAAILTLLFVGNSIHAAKGVDNDAALRLHTSIALSAYALLWVRIVWRLVKRHPDRLPRQKRWSYAAGRWFHWLLLAAIAAMLITGPLMAWAGGMPVRLFALEIPAPFAPSPALFGAMHAGHVFAASILGWGALLHILAAVKHIAVDRDGSFDRMMTPHHDAGDSQNAERTDAASPSPEEGSEMTYVSAS